MISKDLGYLSGLPRRSLPAACDNFKEALINAVGVNAMPAWFWLLVLTALGAGAMLVARICVRKFGPGTASGGDGNEALAPEPLFAPDGPEGFLLDMQEERTRCPYCLDKAPPSPLQGKALDEYRAALDGLDALAASERHEKALAVVESLIPVAPLTDHLRLITALYDAFEGLCEELAPAEVLALFDRLAATGRAIPFALAHNQEDALAAVLAYSLGRYPPAREERDLACALAFLRQPHPLIKALHRIDPQGVVDFINLQASDVYNAWEDITASPASAMNEAERWLARQK